MQTYNFGNIDGEDAVDGAVGETGDTGQTGVGFLYRGDWVAGGAYSNGDNIDIVKYKDNLYYCKRSTTVSDPPDYDTQTWGIFQSGESCIVLRCSFSSGDWSSYYDEILQETVQKAVAQFPGVTIPNGAKYFIRIDPDVRKANNIELAGIGTNTITFYADNAVNVTIDFCYKLMKETTVRSEIPPISFTEFDITLTEDTGKEVSIPGWSASNFPIDWGDGEVNSSNWHEYEEYGDYTIKVKGDIGNIAIGGFFGRSGNKNYSVTAARFYNDALAEYGLAYCAALISAQLSGDETHIAEGAFAESGIRGISIPYNVFEVRENAFYRCNRLESVSMQRVQEIGANCFEGCERLTSINTGSVVTIGADAFNGCSRLSSIDLSSVRTLGGGAFQECTSLTSVTIPAGVRVIPEYLFYQSGRLERVNLPSTITEIKYMSFRTDGEHLDIYYNGTMDDWDAISKSAEWGYATVHCTDGDII